MKNEDGVDRTEWTNKGLYEQTHSLINKPSYLYMGKSGDLIYSAGTKD